MGYGNWVEIIKHNVMKDNIVWIKNGDMGYIFGVMIGVTRGILIMIFDKGMDNYFVGKSASIGANGKKEIK